MLKFSVDSTPAFKKIWKSFFSESAVLESYNMYIEYTGGTLKLLFVIFGRLSYFFFVHLMVWGNGRLS